MKESLNAKQVQQALDKTYQGVVSLLPKGQRVAIIGLRTRGETLARRILERLRRDMPSLQIDFGVVDITFYRDDLSRRRGAPLVRATEIDFDLDDSWVLLVDDVIQSGRSIRAAMDALHDFGRPKAIRLAVLVDRGGRELPISADVVGQRIEAAPGERIQVKLKEIDGEDSVCILRKKD